MSQTIIKGIDGLNEIIDGKSFLLVSTGLSRYPELSKVIDSHPHACFSEFTSNPLYEQVCEGIRIFNAEACELIVAVGGGSAIDVAKCIKLYCKMNPEENYLRQEAVDTGIPLVAIPTTAGTGSESTRHAVIYYGGVKQSVSHPSIVPDYAILESSVLKTLPVYQKKCTMLDALCQAIESWWSVNSTDESVGYSKAAIELIKENWQAYINENSASAAERIMEAANLAGRAINITATTAAHAMSYKITSLYRLPHGHAVAVCMREVWSYMLSHTCDCIDVRGNEHLENVFKSLPVDISWFMMLMDELQMECPESESKENDVELLASSVNPTRLKNNPVELSKEVLLSMYERIVK